jgi:biopolymer transport protein ExbB
MYAACNGRKECISFLLEKGADIEAKDKDGWNALIHAAINGYKDCVSLLLEKGLIWISLFIALAPMLGFLGTVVGMIQAFDASEIAGDISPSWVAGGIKVALLTTVFGLIAAMILQIFYNLIVAMIDNLVNKMEDASITFLDIVAAHIKK